MAQQVTLKFIWWFLANHAVRWMDARSGRFVPDILYSPGVNCLDADVIAVLIVFAEFYARVRRRLTFPASSLQSWPLLLHRRLYYQLIMWLENRIYRREKTVLIGLSQKVTQDLQRFYQKRSNLRALYHGVDSGQFSPQVRENLRAAPRSAPA
jgi:hypothetical protein